MSMSDLPSCFPGFEAIHRYMDRRDDEVVAELRPGDFYVTKRGERIITILGSCVAACVRDVKVGVGGMNHFLLPNVSRSAPGSWSDAARYGSYAMETLINEVLKRGGAKNRLEIKIFGGARIIEGLSDVGAKNVDFVTRYLDLEQLSVESKDVGGEQARVVHYWPVTGRVRVKKIKGAAKLAATEVSYGARISDAVPCGDVELF